MARRRVIFGCIVSLVALGAGGCPVVLDETVERPAAGQFWVAEYRGELSYFAPAARRGEAHAWIPIGTDDASWFVGPALYEYSEKGWTLIGDPQITSLDEVVQLHDPPPGMDE
ncbi:MAG: hypothetical protein CHACPFDD_03803 [Phycisphaerae bacterium]|nr:hypothetical protein [Phycisphaerae bacterium]